MRMFAHSGPKLFRLIFLVLTTTLLVPRIPADDDTAGDLPVENEPLVRVTEPQSELRLVEKFAKVVELKNRITTVYGFDPEVVSVTKVDLHPNQIRVHALTPGVTSLVLVDEKNTSFTIEAFVIGDVRHLQAYIKNLFPDDAVTAIAVKDSVVLRGYVSRPENIPRIMDIAKEFYPNVINQMEVGGNQEVLLKVRVIEIDRTKLRQLGFNFIGMTNNAFLNTSPGALAPLATLNTPIGGPPDLSVNPQKFTTAPSFIGGVLNNNYSLSGFLQALEQESLLKILANPILVTTNGQPANMLSGGQFPILVPQSLGTVTIQWKEFGVRLSAVPLLLGNGRIRLNLQPEVSQKDFSTAVTTNGFTVPGLTTRRVNTSVEMRFGETFMLGGLIEVQDTSQTFKVPWLGELPYIGAAFRSVQYATAETELVILVTPVPAGAMTDAQTPPGGPGMFTDAPTDRELYQYGLIEVPSYGNHCSDDCGAGGYPPSIIDFDMQHNTPGPMINPNMGQPIPPGPAGMAPRMIAPSPDASLMPPNAAPLQAAPPAEGGPANQAGPQSSLLRQQKIRQVSAQSAGGGNSTIQAGYSTVARPATSPRGRYTRPAQSSSAAQPGSSGLFEPQSGLYVPTGSASP